MINSQTLSAWSWDSSFPKGADCSEPGQVSSLNEEEGGMLTKLCHCPPLVDTGVASPCACIKGRPDGALPLNFLLMRGNFPLLTWEVPFGKSIYCRTVTAACWWCLWISRQNSSRKPYQLLEDIQKVADQGLRDWGIPEIRSLIFFNLGTLWTELQ